MLTTANHQVYYPLTANKLAGGIGLLFWGGVSRMMCGFFASSVLLWAGWAGSRSRLAGAPSVVQPVQFRPPRLDSAGGSYNELEHPMQNDTLSHLETRAIKRAITILENKFTTNQALLTSPDAVKKYLRLRIGSLEHEEFHVLWLNTQNKLIAAEKLFTGTLTRTEIHPRELVKSALTHNAASAIFAHNHPSGKAIASAADLELTENLKAILYKIEVRVLDHIIVTALEAISLSEQGAM